MGFLTIALAVVLLSVCSSTREETDRWRAYFAQYNGRIALALAALWLLILCAPAAPAAGAEIPLPLRALHGRDSIFRGL
jgi:hypothetical protein